MFADAEVKRIHNLVIHGLLDSSVMQSKDAKSAEDDNMDDLKPILKSKREAVSKRDFREFGLNPLSCDFNMLTVSFSQRGLR